MHGDHHQQRHRQQRHRPGRRRPGFPGRPLAVVTLNTIANNDSTATASLAFANGIIAPSTEQPAGIVSRAHTAAMNTALGTTNGFSQPAPFSDNIIWQNRAFHWDPTLNPPALVLSTTAPAPFWDLGVLGAAGSLNPISGVLTNLSNHGAVYSGTNSTADPNLVGAYFNGPRGLLIPGEVTTNIPSTAIAVDEGGNAIDVAFGPLIYTGAYTSNSGEGAGSTGIGVLSIQGGSGGGGGGGGGWACFLSAASDPGPCGSGIRGHSRSARAVGAVCSDSADGSQGRPPAAAGGAGDRPRRRVGPGGRDRPMPG